MSEATFDEYIAHWRHAQPQREVAWLFLQPAERIRYGGLACLQQEWLKALREINEPQVAAVKLGWWREEMQRAARGEARHPLTQTLFADARVRAVPPARWMAAVDAALLSLNAAPAADFDAQHAAVASLANAFAALETCVAFGAGASIDKAAAVWVIGILVTNLRALASEVGHGRSPLPMNLLARHGVTRDALLEDTPARRLAIHDYAEVLQRTFADAAKMAGPLTLLRSDQLRCNLDALGAAVQAAEPLSALRAQRGGLRDVLKTWRAARISRQVPYCESTDATT